MDETKEKEKVLTPKQIQIIIPQCCREGWDDCIHSAKKLRPKKRNLGL